MNPGDLLDKFLDSVPFELYPAQEEALLAWFESSGGVLVTAPTGMGKTLIAEAAIFEALHTGQRLYYTTPLIALTDQKFREFQDQAELWGFPRDKIGLITGNRRINADAPVRVVVAEILLNHLLGDDEQMDDVSGVVMDEFHYFNDQDRGVVWELSLMLLPESIRVMLLSATVGNPVEFVSWLSKEHGRKVQLVQTDQRRVPLSFHWVGDKLVTDLLADMVSKDEDANRTPALVFCFNRDECWSVAERLKGRPLISADKRIEVEKHLEQTDFSLGIGPKLRQMLIRGVGVHHAGVLPKYKQIVEELFLKKLTPFVICTETLAAGINLPARSVVLTTLIKGKRGQKRLVAPSAAHQMFGRAGRPQFDTAGHVFSLAHEDDARIAKWQHKYDQIDAKSKDPGLMRMRKQLERKRPKRGKNTQYWTEGQFNTLIEAKPAPLASRGMISYHVLIFLLRSTGTLEGVRRFITTRFNTAERIAKFQDQLDHMVSNLAALGFLTKCEDTDTVTLSENVTDLMNFRSVDSLFGTFLARQLERSTYEDKLQVLESVLQLPPAIDRHVRPVEADASPFQQQVVEPQLIKLGLVIADPGGGVRAITSDEQADFMFEDESADELTLPEMLKMLFDARLVMPESIYVQPKSAAGGIIEFDGDFYKFVRGRDLLKNEGLILRHLLRLTILASEFAEQTDGDPDYTRISEAVTEICRTVDPRYTDRFLESDREVKLIAEQRAGGKS